MHSLLSRKAQFFIVSSFFIIMIAFLISRWIEPWTIVDISEIILHEETFLFNNFVEKAEEVIKSSKDVEELRYNLEEYVNFVSDFARAKGYNFTFNYQLIPTPGEPPSAFAVICLKLKSPRVSLATTKLIEWES